MPAENTTHVADDSLHTEFTTDLETVGNCSDIETVEMPKEVVVAGNRPYLPHNEAQPDVVQSTDLFEKTVNELRRGLFEKGYGAKALPAFSILAGLVLMRHGVETDAPATAREDNAALLPSAAQSALAGQKNSQDGALMRLNTIAVNQDLKRITSLTQLHAVLGWMPGVIRNNLAVTEQHLGGMIRTAVKRVSTIAEGEGPLKYALEGAIKWIQLPSKRAQETRRDHEKLLAEKGQKGNKDETPPQKGESEPTTGNNAPATPPTKFPRRD